MNEVQPPEFDTVFGIEAARDRLMENMVGEIAQANKKDPDMAPKWIGWTVAPSMVVLNIAIHFADFLMPSC